MQTIHGGWFAGVLDSAMGFAVVSTLPQGQTFTTLEIKLNIVRALPPGVAAVARAGSTIAAAAPPSPPPS